MIQLLKTRLSVNINKVATIRNARGGTVPDILQIAKDCEKFGADGITVHPRPDQRHITYDDVRQLKKIVNKEFNIEGNPTEEWLNLVLEVKPDQATLVPDAPDQKTSDSGYNTVRDQNILKPIVAKLQDAGIRVSIFIDANPKMAVGAAQIGADRIELYTGPYAKAYEKGHVDQILPLYAQTAQAADNAAMEVNAGHDLDLNNLKYFVRHVSPVHEVSIGHALISDALYYGLEETIKKYQDCLK